jgi:RNA polymerase sigma factor (sigma-70 family)
MPSHLESPESVARLPSLLRLASEEYSDAQLLARFVEHRDETAFAALVERYGPMVLGVCRRQLFDAHAAEDAFQATFVVLVRKAATIDRPELLGNWLYGVAFRVSVKARATAARRSAHERQAASMPKSDTPPPDTDQRELRQLLDEELSRLPDKYRAPLVLCYLEGKTNEEAAAQLGCPLGSMSWRLNRGRDMLRRRLRGRSLALPATIAATLLTESMVQATVPFALAQTTVRSSIALASGQATHTVLSPSVAALVEETLPLLAGVKATLFALVLSVVALLFSFGGTGAFTYYWLSQGPPRPAVPCLDHPPAAKSL